MKYDIYFQDPAALAMESIRNLHDNIMFYLVLVVLFVGYIMLNILIDFIHIQLSDDNSIEHILRFHILESYEVPTHNTNLELVWTLTPSLILFVIAIPSFYLLYELDSSVDTKYTLKVLGHQWYWSYETQDNSKMFHKSESINQEIQDLTYNRILNFFRTYKFNMKNNLNYLTLDKNFGVTPKYRTLITLIRKEAEFPKPNLNIDSYLIEQNELKLGHLRLLEVSEYPIMPINIPVKFIISSLDVLHSWAIPAFGIKIDAVPGRLNQVVTMPLRLGSFYGQCSELCGVGHGFMPIKVDVALSVKTLPKYTYTIKSQTFEPATFQDKFPSRAYWQAISDAIAAGKKKL